MKNGYDRYLEFQYDQSSGFYEALFRVIAIADDKNIERLALGFPEEVDAYKLWTRSGVEFVFDKCNPGPLLARARQEYDADEAPAPGPFEPARD